MIAGYKSNFKSPSLIQPIFRKGIAISGVNIAGSTMDTKSKPIQEDALPKPSAAIIPMGPTRPQVPIPEAIATPFSSRNTQVATGPVIAAANVGGIQILDCGQYCPSAAWRCLNPGLRCRPSRFHESSIRQSRPSGRSSPL